MTDVVVLTSDESVSCETAPTGLVVLLTSVCVGFSDLGSVRPKFRHGPLCKGNTVLALFCSPANGLGKQFFELLSVTLYPL